MVILIGAWLLLAAAPHPIHVSVLEGQWRAGGQLELTLRVFTDDLELALRRQYGEPVQPLRLGTPRQAPAADSLIQAYVLAHLRLLPDGKAVQLRYVGHEYEQEAMYVYLEATGVPDFGKLQVHNSLLLTLYDDQSNLCNMTHRGRTLSLRTRRGEEQGELKWE